MRPILTLGSTFAVLGLLLVACGDGRSGAGHAGTSVVAGFYPLAEAAHRIGGDCVSVTNLTPPGVEPHDLELTTDDVEALATADVVLLMGGGFQPAVEEGAEASEGTVIDILDAADASLHVSPSEAGDGLSADPHVWLDPGRWADAVRTIGDDLAAVLPAPCHAQANAEAYASQLDALDAAFSKGLAECERTTIVTTHAAFGYLADAYGLTQEAVAGVVPESEPSAQRLAELRDLVEREGITTIFTEDLVPPDVAETLAAEAGVRVATLHTLEGLTDDQLAAGADYRSVMRENLATLEEALGCG
jgi:zinc transport system substrate-binding protein